MNTILKKIAFTACVATLLLSCKKNNEGGKAEIHARITHNFTPVNAATLYVKYGTQKCPSDIESNCDLKIMGEEMDNHVHVENMRYGEYYIYAVGFDSTISQIVKGGVAVKIKWSERKQTIDVDIPVVE